VSFHGRARSRERESEWENTPESSTARI
jgi:hypothetical protein